MLDLVTSLENWRFIFFLSWMAVSVPPEEMLVLGVFFIPKVQKADETDRLSPTT